MARTLEEHLDTMGADFDEEYGLLGRNIHHPGYHTNLPQGAYAHGTRENFEYAVLLLRSNRPEDHQRANRVLLKALESQETDPTEQPFGIWPWYADEPIAQMDKPDYNWADFCGAMIATILRETPERLPAETVEALRVSLDRAAAAIFRRNVASSYTNIAIMGAGVSAMAGEILDAPFWLAYGRRRLARFIEDTERHGGLNEYNSPTYTFVALHECERVLQLVEDATMRETAEKLRRMIWRFLAERFHPATGQMAGPHSRAYADLLRPDFAREIAEATGVAIPGAPEPSDDDPRISTLTHLPCPEDIRPRFAVLPEEPCFIHGRFILREPDEASTTGTTWLAADACLGSVNYDCLWIQRRPLIAYIATPGATPAVLKAQFLRDGHPCAAAALRCVQEGPRALCTFEILTDRGDHHIHMGRPEGGIYTCSDLRYRFELTGEGARAEQIEENRFALEIAGWRAVVHPGESVFDGRECTWEITETEGAVAVDAVLRHTDAPEGIPFPELGKCLTLAALELLAPGEAPSAERPVAQDDGDAAECRWSALTLRAHARPHILDLYVP